MKRREAAHGVGAGLECGEGLLRGVDASGGDEAEPWARPCGGARGSSRGCVGKSSGPERPPARWESRAPRPGGVLPKLSASMPASRAAGTMACRFCSGKSGESLTMIGFRVATRTLRRSARTRAGERRQLVHEPRVRRGDVQLDEVGVAARGPRRAARYVVRRLAGRRSGSAGGDGEAGARAPRKASEAGVLEAVAVDEARARRRSARGRGWARGGPGRGPTVMLFAVTAPKPRAIARRRMRHVVVHRGQDERVGQAHPGQVDGEPRVVDGERAGGRRSGGARNIAWPSADRRWPRGDERAGHRTPSDKGGRRTEEHRARRRIQW